MRQFQFPFVSKGVSQVKKKSRRRTSSVSDTELAVLKVLWELGQATVRDLMERLEEQGRTWAYTTVQTLVIRLREKGFVSTRKDGKAHLFTPTISQRELLSLELGDLAERVCDGRATPLMLTLVRENTFTAQELAELRAMLDDLDARQGR